MVSNKSFDFEYWARLAKEQPEEFESKRAELLEQLIESSPPKVRQRLHSIQWRVDCERERSPTPLSACLKISRMMWDAVYERGGFMSLVKSDVNSMQKADLLAFHKDKPH